MGCAQEPQFENRDYPYRHLPLDTLQYSYGSAVGTLATAALNEVSGVAASTRHPGVLWLHNDSGDSARVFAIDTLGNSLGVFPIRARNEDWEALAIGPGPDTSQSYLYLGDVGDNDAQRPFVVIYRVAEPDPRALLPAPLPADTFRVRYPDGSRDTEALLLDPYSQELLLITKREDAARIYVVSLHSPRSADSVQAAEFRGTIPIVGVTDGAVRPDGSAVLLRTYNQLFLFPRRGRESLVTTLARHPIRLGYLPGGAREPQGEAIAWQGDGQAFYTVSEAYQGQEVVLYRYVSREQP